MTNPGSPLPRPRCSARPNPNRSAGDAARFEGPSPRDHSKDGDGTPDKRSAHSALRPAQRVGGRRGGTTWPIAATARRRGKWTLRRFAKVRWEACWPTPGREGAPERSSPLPTVARPRPNRKSAPCVRPPGSFRDFAPACCTRRRSHGHGRACRGTRRSCTTFVVTSSSLKPVRTSMKSPMSASSRTFSTSLS